MNGKVWDVVAPKNKWESYYAKMEYHRLAWHDLWNFAQPIEVNSDIYICGYCLKEYVGADPFTCSEKCSYLLDEEVDRRRGK